jgi:hypothetical protein
MTRHDVKWSDEQTDYCFKLKYEDKLTAEKVAEKMTMKYKTKFTKGMVLGRIHRVIGKNVSESKGQA